MKKEDHINLIREIRLNLEDEGMVSEKLKELSDDYETVLNQLEQQRSDIEQKDNDYNALLEKNEKLREANMNLFLQIGTPVEQREGQNAENTDPEAALNKYLEDHPV